MILKSEKAWPKRWESDQQKVEVPSRKSDLSLDFKVASKILKGRPIAKKVPRIFKNERLGLEKCNINL